jgi:hypothetical protein
MIESSQLEAKPKIIANGSLDGDVFTGSGMLKPDRGCVEHHAFHSENIPEVLVLLDIAVPDITNNRMIDMRKMLPDLVPAPRFGAGLHQ